MGAGSVITGIPQVPGATLRNAMGGTDPFTMMNQMYEFKNRQMQFNANMEFGRLATQYANDPDGLARAAQSSAYAPYMMDNIKTLREAQLAAAQTTTQTYNQREAAARAAQTNFTTGTDLIDWAYKNSGGNPDNFDLLMAAGSAKMPQETRQQLQPLLGMAHNTITGDLKGTTPEERQAEFAGRYLKLLLGAGIPLERAYPMAKGYGLPSITEIGTTKEPYITAPILTGTTPGMYIGGAGGGAVTPGGEPITPQSNQLGGQTQQTEPVLGPGGELIPAPTQGTAPAGPALSTPQTGAAATAPSRSAIPAGTPAVIPRPPPGSIVPPQQAREAMPTEPFPTVNPFATPKQIQADRAGDGRELYPDFFPEVGQTKRPPLAAGLTGNWALGAEDDAVNKEALKRFEEDKPMYEYSQQAMGSLQLVDADMDNLFRAASATGNPLDNYLTPGTDLEQRGKIANELNTLASIFGLKNPFSAKNVADVQEMSKIIHNMSIQLAKTTFGGQREAASTIQRIADSLPTMDNSYLGSKYVIATIRAMTQRQIDLNNFVQRWQGDKANHGGTIAGAGEAFNALHPVGDYLDRALAPLGMDANFHFRGPNVEGTAQDFVKKGMLSWDQAAAVLREQGYKD